MDSCGHVKDALGQFDMLTGALVDDLVEQLQNEVVGEPGFQHLLVCRVGFCFDGPPPNFWPGGVREFGALSAIPGRDASVFCEV